MDSRVIFSVYILIISVVTFSCFGIDKWKAANHKWRIQEATLIGLCIIGGSLGGLAGMFFFHHKTRKALFIICVPMILIVQIIGLMMLLRMFWV